MARCLIIACGCRGRVLGRELGERGHAVRGSTRRESELAEMQAIGIEPHHGDPDRVGTLAPAFERVSVACVLLGSATGPAEAVRALHETRLEMLLERMLDTTIRGIVYEAAGSVDAAVLAGGTAIVRRRCEGSLIPYALLQTDPGAERAAWLREAVTAVQRLLVQPA
ncbi:MAG: hypothetical protein M3Z27_05235 [Actinomycetota bacterium]|nr:hypothetical protein [Actinomycetota bacterium]